MSTHNRTNPFRVSTLLRWMAPAVLSVLLLGAGVARAAAQPKDEQSVRQLFSDFTDALNRHDARAVAALCTEDVDFIVISGTDIRGRSAVVEHLQPLFDGILKNMNRQAMLQEVRFLHPDVALLVGSYVSNGVSAPGGREIPPTPGVYDWVVVRRNGHWLITLWREANRPAPAPPRP